MILFAIQTHQSNSTAGGKEGREGRREGGREESLKMEGCIAVTVVMLTVYGWKVSEARGRG